MQCRVVVIWDILTLVPCGDIFIKVFSIFFDEIVLFFRRSFIFIHPGDYLWADGFCKTGLDRVVGFYRRQLFEYLTRSCCFLRKNERMSEWAIYSKNEWFACSLIFGERPEQITHGCSFLVSDLSDSLTSLIFRERPERFAHIAHQKRGNERIAHFSNKKRIKNILKIRF